MKLHYLFGAVAASALLAGAAYAQSTTVGASASPTNTTGGVSMSTGVTQPNNPTSPSAMPMGDVSGNQNVSAGVNTGGAMAAPADGATAVTAGTMPSGSMSSGMSGSMSGMPSDASASAGMSGGVSATSATSYGAGASVTTTTTTNGPVPDTAENRAKYGQPMSHAGKRTAPAGN